ncbi:histidine phosphatase family protein [Microvirga subterranea]|uniref:Histidine phosphatase superfamily protein (Branch 1) n=1 Tax=Microvirga subterranea TaxID=186651 RepID=A0A370HWJ4_9HYPH|nr:histidine phosphatase family protein [Microvirga subterranea]RDI62660.1 histidine phosphatase superfamily protein (branch 1) [Microvirga subterranea]
MRLLLFLTMAMMTGWAQPGIASDAAWQALRNGGTVALLRHARAPGTGDPAGFRLDDCSSQRNLSPAGRKQAQELGERFEAQGVRVERVLASRWCRALDTARLAFGDRVEPYPPLDSFFSQQSRNDAQTREVGKLVSDWKGPGVLALVTHQVNITALTTIFPAEGEVLVLRPSAGGFEVVGRINP